MRVAKLKGVRAIGRGSNLIKSDFHGSNKIELKRFLSNADKI
jgi:hypothetical protein